MTKVSYLNNIADPATLPRARFRTERDGRNLEEMGTQHSLHLLSLKNTGTVD